MLWQAGQTQLRGVYNKNSIWLDLSSDKLDLSQCCYRFGALDKPAPQGLATRSRCELSRLPDSVDARKMMPLSSTYLPSRRPQRLSDVIPPQAATGPSCLQK